MWKYIYKQENILKVKYVLWHQKTPNINTKLKKFLFFKTSVKSEIAWIQHIISLLVHYEALPISIKKRRSLSLAKSLD
jgi:hypothetical protein